MFALYSDSPQQPLNFKGCGECEYSADIIGGVTSSILYILLDANVILTGQGERDIQRLCGGESKLEKCQLVVI